MRRRLLPPFLICLLSLALALPPAVAQAPIQEWIDAAVKAGGGVVTIPPGVHELPAGLRLDAVKKLAIRGMERERCILRLAPGAKPPLIHIRGAADTVEIANLVLEPGSSTKISADSPAILCAPGDEVPKPTDGPIDITLRDCIFHDWPGDAILFQDTRDAGVERCSFRDIGGTAVVIAAGSKAVTVSGCWITRAAAAIQARDAAICELLGNEIRQCTEGILISGTTALKQPERPTGHKIVANSLTGIPKLALQVTATAAPAWITDNQIQGTQEIAGQGHQLRDNVSD